MATFYDEMAVMALEMITEFGQPMIIRTTQPGEYDPDIGGEVPGPTFEQKAQGILLDFTGQEFQANSLIQQGDKKIMLAAKGLTWPPTLVTTILADGLTWTIVNVKNNVRMNINHTYFPSIVSLIACEAVATLA